MTEPTDNAPQEEPQDAGTRQEVVIDTQALGDADFLAIATNGEVEVFESDNPDGPWTPVDPTGKLEVALDAASASGASNLIAALRNGLAHTTRPEPLPPPTTPELPAVLDALAKNERLTLHLEVHSHDILAWLEENPAAEDANPLDVVNVIHRPTEGMVTLRAIDPITKQESGDSVTLPASELLVTLTHNLRVTLWCDEGKPGVYHYAGVQERNTLELTPPPVEWGAFAAALNARNLRLGLQPPPEPKPEVSKRGALAPRPAPLPATVRFKSDSVHGAAVRAFACVAEWTKGLEGFLYGTKQEFRNAKVTVGLPDSKEAQDLWTFLCRGGAPMVKAHYALWARWYESPEDDAQYITVSINQFCADLGYKPHHRGGYRKERKQEAAKLLRALTSVELRAVFTTPNGKAGRLRGPLWQRGLLAEEADRYADLFGQAREGDPDLWEPVAFSYAPGPFFQDEEWRRFNSAVGRIGAGLMRLANDTDEWAILIGGYLGTLIRTNEYKPLRLRVATILDATNLAQTTDAKRRHSLYQDRFERALDRLVDVGVLASWTWPEVDTTELAEPDDPDALVEYYASDPLPPGDWRRRLVELTLLPELEEAGAVLQERKQKRIAAARRRRGAAAKKKGQA